MANWPSFDPNDLADATSDELENRATGFTYEPGSTFKSITVAGALQDGTVSPTTTFDLPPQIQVADRTIGESHPRGPMTLTTPDILAQSSNVGAIKIGLEMGKVRFDYWLRQFGFGKRTGVDLPGEEQGIVMPVSKYSGSSMGNLPIGQGQSVTPMQMAQAYAAIANGGMLRSPRVVRLAVGRRQRARLPERGRVLPEEERDPLEAGHRPATIYNMDMGYTVPMCVGLAMALAGSFRDYGVIGRGQLAKAAAWQLLFAARGASAPSSISARVK